MEQCPHIESVGAYHDGELTGVRQREMEAHLSRCPQCAAELVELDRLSIAIMSEETPLLSREATARFHEHVEGLTDRSILRFAQLLSGIAAAVLIGVGGWLMNAPPAPVENAPPWERAAVTLRPEAPGESGSMGTAQWIVTELAMQR